jgi:hypothetical protein
MGTGGLEQSAIPQVLLLGSHLLQLLAQTVDLAPLLAETLDLGHLPSDVPSLVLEHGSLAGHLARLGTIGVFHVARSCVEVEWEPVALATCDANLYRG